MYGFTVKINSGYFCDEQQHHKLDRSIVAIRLSIRAHLYQASDDNRQVSAVSDVNFVYNRVFSYSKILN